MNMEHTRPWTPMFAVWELTLACNMRCLHCGSYAGRPREDEISLERALQLVDELADLGLKRITLSGGEPLLRKGWEQIARRLMDRGVRVGMISNGWYVAENIEAISKVGKWDLIAMSLDGLRMTHDAFRRTPGSYDSILAGFRALKKKGIRSACITCVSRYNINEIDTIHDVLSSHGVSAWQIQPLFIAGRLKENLDMMLNIRELIDVVKFTARKAKVSPMQVFPADGVGYFTHYEEKIRPYGWTGCHAGLHAIGIEANGNIKGCLSLNPEMHKDNPFVEGNIKEKSLKEIWCNPDGFAYNRKFDLSKVEGYCKECSHVEVCRCGCTAVGYYTDKSTYCNTYCINREIALNGEPETTTTVPMTEEFEKQLKEYYAKTIKKPKEKTKLKPSKIFDHPVV